MNPPFKMTIKVEELSPDTIPANREKLGSYWKQMLARTPECKDITRGIVMANSAVFDVM